MNNINEYSYNIALNMYRKLTGDYDTSFENTDDIYTAIDENFDSGDGRYNTEEINLSIDENGEFHYVKTDTVDAYVPVNISVDIKQKYTDEQVTELQSTARQEGYNVGYGVGFNEGSDEGYQDGYAEGLDDGAQDQRDLLEEITITENGIYEKEDGYNKVTVSVAGSGGGSGFDFSEIGYDVVTSMSINSDIQADIDYSKSIKDNWDPNATSLAKKFQYDKIKYMPNVDTSNVTNMSSMFDGSSITYIDSLNTSNVTNMSDMFQNCSSITSVPLFDTSNVTNMSDMFQNTQLESVPAFNTRKVTTFSRCFEIYGNKLTSFPALDCSSCTNVSYLFGISNPNYTNLTDLGGFINLGCKSSLSGTTDGYFLKKVPNLTHESVMNVINNLYDRASAGYSVLKLAMHANHLALLSDEEKAIATNKGWTLT